MRVVYPCGGSRATLSRSWTKYAFEHVNMSTQTEHILRQNLRFSSKNEWHIDFTLFFSIKNRSRYMRKKAPKSNIHIFERFREFLFIFHMPLLFAKKQQLLNKQKVSLIKIEYAHTHILFIQKIFYPHSNDGLCFCFIPLLMKIWYE